MVRKNHKGGAVKTRTPQPGSETASYVWLGATSLILPLAAVYVLAKLIQAGVL